MTGEESDGLPLPQDTGTSCPVCAAREAEEAACYADADALQAEAGRLALDRTIAMNLPLSIDLRPSISHLGSATAKIYAYEMEMLRQAFSSNLPKITACANAAYWHAGWEGATMIELSIARGMMADSEYTRRLTTASGYLGDNGGASTMCSAPLSQQQPLFAQLARAIDLPGLTDFLADDRGPAMHYLLSAQSCHYFSKADELAARGGLIAEVMDFACEAHDLRAQCLVDVGWAGALEFAHESTEVQQHFRRDRARAAAMGRLNKDPRQREKALVHQCWLAWQEDPSRYPSQAAFARDMLAKCEHLVTVRAIENWCRQWGRSTPSS